jgi:hypothetical protein
MAVSTAAPEVAAPIDSRQRWTLHAVAALVTVTVLAPLAAPGYVLSYDMVFVPRQPLRWDLVAPSGLPRAVPLDTVVAVANVVVPGWLLQRIALIALVYVAALGAGRLIPTGKLCSRVAAAVGYAWTPFVAERLLLGHWALLICYAALPWLVRAAMRMRAGPDAVKGALPRLIVAAAACAITPTGGLIALATVAVFTLGRGRRTAGLAIAAVGLLNAPWLIAAVTADAGGRSDPLGAAAFAARGENWSGPIGALVGTGGIWNAQTTPASRAAPLVPVVTVVLLALAVVGWPALRRRWRGGDAVRLTVLAAGGFSLALLYLLDGANGVLGWVVANVPGAGLLRDGQKFLVPYALMLVLCAVLGAERLAARLAPARAMVIMAAVIALPVAVMPDLALGAAGQLRPVAYPDDWDRVVERIAADPGEVLVLPFAEYRTFSWNRNRTVIDPAPRYLPADVLIDDTLYVGDLVVAGENPRAAEVRTWLAGGSSAVRTGVRWVLVERTTGGEVPASMLSGLRLVHSGQFLSLYANPLAGPGPPPPGMVERVLVIGGSVLAAALVLVAIGYLRRNATAW